MFEQEGMEFLRNMKTFSMLPPTGYDVPVELMKFPYVKFTALAIELCRGLQTIISLLQYNH